MGYSDHVIADGASHYWRLNEKSGTVALDIIGGATGTISGGVTLNQPGALADGSKAMTFDGTTGKVVTSANVPVPLTCSVETWLKVTPVTPGVDRPLFSSRRTGATGQAVFIGATAAAGSGPVNPFVFCVSPIYSTRDVGDGAWHHVVYVFDGTTCAFYVDGVFDVSRAQVRTTPSNGLASIGWDEAGSVFWPGALDEVAIYPRALTAPEIKAHYDAGVGTYTLGDSSAIENALMAKLGADTELLSYLPNGVYWDVAPPNSTRFVIVSLVDQHDEPQFGQRSYEDALYLVKAVALVSMNPNIQAAAARIDALLDPQPPVPPATLTIPGYGLMLIARESRVRYTEEDEVDATIKWYHRGGQYRVIASPRDM